ncbi:uncharacterized protein [Rhodnius prolixus]|uniref:uncharacterized protein n=1 Tax=Rhodnius prolixus TaxID=13249 RepID=UPI003D18BF4F
MIRGSTVEINCSKRAVTIIIVIVCVMFGCINIIHGLDISVSYEPVIILMPNIIFIGAGATVLGILCLSFTFIGLYGYYVESAHIIRVYALLLFILTLLFVTAGTFVKSYQQNFKENFVKNIKNAFENYGTDYKYRKAVNTLQYITACCGFHGPKHWANHVTLPRTCCPVEHNMFLMCTKETMYKTGCKTQSIKHFELVLMPMWVNYFVAALFSTLFAIFTICSTLKNCKIRKPIILPTIIIPIGSASQPSSMSSLSEESPIALPTTNRTDQSQRPTSRGISSLRDTFYRFTSFRKTETSETSFTQEDNGEYASSSTKPQ